MAEPQIDVADDLFGQSFKINNPQPTVRRGCGARFSLRDGSRC
jgi:Fe-S cluster assembly iron-binding protein IscA